ncbi:MAG: hypothetical protein KDK10_11000 [Maritimibacter sp.]|nr:hypothetical protein [Maritimibacter sp.]
MTRKQVWKAALGAAVSGIALFAATAAMGQTLVQTTVENRVLLAFKVADAGVQEMLPEGWAPLTLPKGPVAGSNLIVSLFDKLLSLDAEGKPADAAPSPVMALVAYGINPEVEGVRTFVTGIYEVPPLVDPYGVSQAAAIARKATMTYDADGRFLAEDWAIKPESGGAFTLALDYRVGGYGWSVGGTSEPFSPVVEGFHQIYRYDQLAELAMNTTMGKALAGDVSYTADIPALAGLFDGSEALVAVVSIPVYVREVLEP